MSQRKVLQTVGVAATKLWKPQRNISMLSRPVAVTVQRTATKLFSYGGVELNVGWVNRRRPERMWLSQTPALRPLMMPGMGSWTTLMRCQWQQLQQQKQQQVLQQSRSLTTNCWSAEPTAADDLWQQHLNVSTAPLGNPSQSYKALPATWDHTGEHDPPYTSKPILDLPMQEEWKAECWDDLMVRYILRQFSCHETVTHPSSIHLTATQPEVELTTSQS